MIQTPLGTIEMTKDGRSVDCTIRRVRNDNLCPELNGRFAVLIDYIPDGQEHTVSCCIKGFRESKSDFIEPDERVDIKSFCGGTTKLSIGLFSDIPDEWDKTPDDIMDYWTEYLKNGVQYHIRAGAKQAIYLLVLRGLGTKVTKTKFRHRMVQTQRFGMMKYAPRKNLCIVA